MIELLKRLFGLATSADEAGKAGRELREAGSSLVFLTKQAARNGGITDEEANKGFSELAEATRAAGAYIDSLKRI